MHEITEKEIIEKLGDREWRLNHLYHVKDGTGKKVLFQMNPVQQQLYRTLHTRNVIPKARKLGISTFFCIFALDHILFTENRTAGIIAHTQDAMKKMFRNTILFAVENMHPWLKNYIGKPDISTANELKFNNGGQIFVSLTTRGDTPNLLHISELGYISLHAPDKAAEVISGGVNSVTVDPKNMVSIESTADSGRMGPFYEICMAAERLRASGQPLTALDFKIHFFPWWLDPQYELPDAEHVILTQDQEEYFKALEKEIGKKLSIEKKRWWVKSKEVNGQNMFVQFPGTLTEAFSVSLEGAYFKHEMDAVFAENRVAFFPVDPMYPVTTAWDLGMSDSTAISFFQSIGPEIRFIDYYENHGVGLEHYVKVLREKGYSYNKHILPHDIEVKDLSTGVSRLNFLWEMGVRDTIVAPKVFISDSIEKVRILFPRFRFDKAKAGRIAESLQIYRKEFDDTHGTWLEKPWHGPESHCVDTIRTLSTVWVEEFGGTGYVDSWGDKVKDGGVKIVSFFD